MGSASPFAVPFFYVIFYHIKSFYVCYNYFHEGAPVRSRDSSLNGEFALPKGGESGNACKER